MSTAMVYRSAHCCRYKFLTTHVNDALLCWTKKGVTTNKILPLVNVIAGCIRIKNTSSRQFCTFGSNDDVSDSRIKLPRRLVKRLQRQGVTEEEFISRLKASEEEQFVREKKWNAEQELNLTVKDYLVNKFPHDSKSVEIMNEFPSDMPKYQNWEKRRRDGAGDDDIKFNVDPSMTSVVLFPGQGSQFVGMGKNLIQFPGVNELYEEASNILGYDLLKLCLEGPKSELDKTIYCQPSVMITSLAAVEKLREEHPTAIESCVATAGFSVGEFAALVFAGVLNFPDAVTAVKIRAEAMQRASEKEASGMLTVFLAHDSRLKEALTMAREYCKERRGIHDPVCLIANYLFPECKVIAGHAAALEFISTNAKEFGLLRTRRIAVSGAFHTQLMSSAVKPLEKSLQNIQINKPKCTSDIARSPGPAAITRYIRGLTVSEVGLLIPVYSNLTGQRYHEKANFVHKLGQQLVKPVKWEQTMHALYARSQGRQFPQTFELGPSKQMGTFLKQVNLQAFQSYHNIGV